MAVGNGRRWIVRLTWNAEEGYNGDTMWYAGRRGPMGPQIARERSEAHAFDRFPDAVLAKESVLSLKMADQAEIEEV